MTEQTKPVLGTCESCPRIPHAMHTCLDGYLRKCTGWQPLPSPAKPEPDYSPKNATEAATVIGNVLSVCGHLLKGSEIIAVAKVVEAYASHLVQERTRECARLVCRGCEHGSVMVDSNFHADGYGICAARDIRKLDPEAFLK